MKVVIIGGVAGGATAAARLRRLDESAEIVVLERSGYVSYANCGLPYYIGGAIQERGKLTLQTPQSFKRRFNVDVRVHSEAVEILRQTKQVRVRDLESGKEYLESYDKLVYSPGARAALPPFVPRHERVLTLRTVEDTFRIDDFIGEKSPKSALVIGGGFIGLEAAENLLARGLKVTLVELGDQVMPPFDYDMACILHSRLREGGIDLRLSEKVAGLSADERGIRAQIEGKGEICADVALVAVGVSPETQLAKAAGLELGLKGAVVTDEHMRTSDPDIYAVGDAVQVKNFVTGENALFPLAGPANKQGRIAADNICGIPSAYRGTQGSSILKIFQMSVACTGLSETAAKAAGIDYDKTYTYSPSHAGYYPGATNMTVKILWEKESLRLLGAQIVGFDGVDKRVDVLATVIRFGGKVTDLTDLELCYAPPFGSAKDPVNMAGFVAENVITKKVNQFFWHDVDALPRDGSVTLLDVRTETEVARGKIDGFLPIPVDCLRENLDKIPKDKPVYVHCHSGARSYIACRILAGMGYQCYNLAGGWRLYESVVHEKTVPEYICTQCK